MQPFLYNIHDNFLEIETKTFINEFKNINFKIIGYSVFENCILLYLSKDIDTIKLKKYLLDNIPLVETLKSEKYLNTIKIVKIYFLVDVKLN